MIRPWLRLLRIGNGFSPVADVLAGACLAQGDLLAAPVLRAAGASLCVYLSGMVWNDVADRDEDRVERPERPIPRGEITVAAASALGVVLMAGALLLAPAGQRLVVLCLVAGVLAYDFLAKPAVLAGAAVLGVLRAMNLGLGVLAGLTAGGAGDLVPARYWPVAAAYFTYIASLTLLAAREQATPGRPAIATLHLLPLLAHAAVVATAQHPVWALVLVVPFGLALAQAALRALSGWTEPVARASVTLLLLGILVFDAVVAVGNGQFLAGAVILGFFPAARWISRRIALT